MSVRVLVVDDQEPFRRAAAAVVAAADGFQLVGSAETGEASLLAVDDLHPDLVLMDVHLPGIDGFESTRRIRARRPAVRVLLVSSSEGQPDVEECGAMGYLAKRRLSPVGLQDAWAGQRPQRPGQAEDRQEVPAPTRSHPSKGASTMAIHGRTQQVGASVTGRSVPGEEQVEPHSLPQSLALHLLPGVVIAAIFYGAAPLMMRAGFPAIAAGMLGAAVGVLGIELGWLLYQARRLTGTFALSAVLPYRPGRFTWRKGLLAFGLWFWALAASMLLASLKPVMLESFFWWLPGWAVDPLPRDTAATSSAVVLVVTAVGMLLINIILGPAAEELYFRGYLLPRLHRFGIWAPLINISLFSLYHYWTPWDVLTRIVLLVPMAYAVWYTRDIRVGIAVHVGLNGTGYFSNSLPTLLAG